MKLSHVNTILVIGTILTFTRSIWAEEGKFTYRSGRCLNAQGKEGVNEGYFGECGHILDKHYENLDLTLVSLRGAVFENVTFENSRFSFVDFTQAKFTNSRFINDHLSQTNLNRAFFYSSELKDTTFENSTGIESFFSQTEIIGSTFKEFVAEDSFFESVHFANLSMVDSKFSRSSFLKVSFSNSSVSATFENTDFVDISSDKLQLSVSVIKGGTIKNWTNNAPVFSDVSLNGLNVTNLTFAGGSVSNLKILNTSIENFRFQNAKVELADFGKSSFGVFDVIDTEWNGLKSDRNSFSFSHLTRSKFISWFSDSSTFLELEALGSTFGKSIFSSSTFNHSLFSTSSFDDISFDSSVMADSSLTDSNCNKCRFLGTLVRKGSFAGSTFLNTDFRSALFDRLSFSRASFKACDFRSLDLTSVDHFIDASYEHVFYNKKTVFSVKLEEIKKLGFDEKMSKGVFILTDIKGGNSKTISDYLISNGLDVTVSDQNFSTFDGSGLSSSIDYQTIIKISGSDYESDLPAKGQKALVDFVKAGGNFIGFQWDGYMVKNGKYKTMADLVLFSYDTGFSGEVGDATINSDVKDSAILAGVSTTFKMNCAGGNYGKAATGSSVYVVSPSKKADLVATRPLGSGMVMGFSVAPNYDSNSTCFNEKNIKQIILNFVQ